MPSESPALAPATRSELNPPPAPAPTSPSETVTERLVEDDLLVEDVSIDGMCGVY